ncbi:MAG: outer membrane beta-barrel protein [Ignavibacteria bacterium]|nr:outer membrane beta-barrel protein [Ignavibacteria bacterium]
MKKLTLILILFILSAAVSFAQTPLRIGANVGGAFPSGTFSDLYKSGISVELTALYSPPVKNLELTFTAGYNRFKYNNEYTINELRKRVDAMVVNFNPDWNVSVIPVMLGARYKFPTSDFTPYFSGEIGLQFMNFNKRFNGTTIADTSSNQTLLYINGGSSTEDETGFSASLGAGMEFPAAENVMIDIGFKYNFGTAVFSKSYDIIREIDNSVYKLEELKNISFISGRIGVIISF